MNETNIKYMLSKRGLVELETSLLEAILDEAETTSLFTHAEKQTLAKRLQEDFDQLIEFYHIYDHATPKYFRSQSLRIHDLQRRHEQVMQNWPLQVKQSQADKDQSWLPAYLALTNLVGMTAYTNALRICAIFLRLGGKAIDTFVGDHHLRVGQQGDVLSQAIDSLGPLATLLSIWLYVLRLVPAMMLMLAKIIWLHDDLKQIENVRWTIFSAELAKRCINFTNLMLWLIINWITNIRLADNPVSLTITAAFLIGDIALQFWQRHQLRQSYEALGERIDGDENLSDDLKRKLLIALNQKQHVAMNVANNNIVNAVTLVLGLTMSFSNIILTAALPPMVIPLLLLPAVALTATQDKALATALMLVMTALVLVATPQITLIAGMIINLGAMSMLMSNKQITKQQTALADCYQFVFKALDLKEREPFEVMRTQPLNHLRKQLFLEQQNTFDGLVRNEWIARYELYFNVIVLKTLIPITILTLCAIYLPAGIGIASAYIGINLMRLVIQSQTSSAVAEIAEIGKAVAVDGKRPVGVVTGTGPQP